MGRIANAFSGVSPSVNFSAVKAASIPAVPMLVSRWLPHGKLVGYEWTATNPTRSDGRPGSFKINTVTGVWADFATGERGGDMIDLHGYLYGGDALSSAKEIGELLGVPLMSNVAQLHTVARGPMGSSTLRVRELMAPDLSQRDPETLPPRTLPDQDKKPRFVVAGDEGPPVFSDEKRRHSYKAGTTPLKIKVMRRNGDALLWYRVSTDGVNGWQSRKPIGFRGVPFIGHLDPFDSERLNEPVYWPEGEKDADTVTTKGALAMTFGGTGDGLPNDCEEYFRDRHVIILADNDAPGRKHAEEKAALAFPVATSVRVVHFTEVPHKGDVSDFFQLGRTLQDLQQIVSLTMPYKPRTADAAPLPPEVHKAAVLTATPYTWTDPSTIPRRDFVYGRHLIRKFVSATIAPGGVGKSSLIVTETLSMVSGKPLLGIQPACRLRVWLWNLEDPHEEIARHIQATAQRFNLTAKDIDGHLFVDSGRDQRLVITHTDRTGTTILEPVVDALVAELTARGIDHLVVDPFVSSHEAPENDNGAMDRIVKAWGRVAQRANCSIELVHHSRKSSAGETETTAESARGGKALTDGCRSVRVLNRMSKEEGENADVENPRSYFRVFVDKANLAPPAETSDWFHLESVDLGNNPTGGYGDSIGVVVPWQWPDLMADVTVSDLRAVQAAVSKGRYRASPQAGDWVGHAVADVLRLDLNKPNDKRKAANLLKVWMASGALKKQTDKDAKGNDRPYVVVGEWAND